MFDQYNPLDVRFVEAVEKMARTLDNKNFNDIIRLLAEKIKKDGLD